MGDYQSVRTADGEFAIYVDRPNVSSAPAIVVLHEIFGVNKDMRSTCRELAEQGFVAISPDLFWRREPGLDLNEWSEADWKKGLSLYSEYDFKKGVDDVKATIEKTRTLAGTSGKVGVMGFCLGGLMTFLTAARSRVDAAVEYYGGGTEKYLDEAPEVDDPLLIHLGEDDEYITREAQARIKAAFQSKSNVEIFSYPGCSHAFARHTGTHYDEIAAKAANQRTLDFFHRYLH